MDMGISREEYFRITRQAGGTPTVIDQAGWWAFRAELDADGEILSTRAVYFDDGTEHPHARHGCGYIWDYEWCNPEPPRYSAAKIGIDSRGRYTGIIGYVGPRRWWSDIIDARAVAMLNKGSSAYEIHVVQEGSGWQFDPSDDGCPDGCLCIPGNAPSDTAIARVRMDLALQEAREQGDQWVQLGGRKVNR